MQSLDAKYQPLILAEGACLGAELQRLRREVPNFQVVMAPTIAKLLEVGQLEERVKSQVRAQNGNLP